MSTNLGAATAICTVGEDHTFYRAVLAGDQTGATYTLALWSSGVYRSPIALTLDGSDGSNGLTVAYDSEADETTVVAALTETQTATTLGAGDWYFDLLQSLDGAERRGKTYSLHIATHRRRDKVTIEEPWSEGSTEAVTVLQGPPGPKGDKGDPGEGGGGGSGTVTSVAITGANGISVSGSPITDAGTIALSVDAATLRAHLDVLTSTEIATTLEDYVTATGLSTTLEDYALASSVPTEPGDIGAAAATHSHAIADVTGLQTALDGRLVAASNLSDLASASTARTNLGLAAVAASGDYGDLANTPSLATVATTGSYDDLSDTPTLGTAAVLDAGVANGAATLDSSGVLPAEQLTAHALTAHSDWVGGATPAAGMAVVVVSLSGLGDVPQFDVRDLTAADIKSGTLAVARGGTGATDAATARTNLGAIGNASGSGATITGVWVGSQAEYDLLTPSAGVLYFVEEE